MTKEELDQMADYKSFDRFGYLSLMGENNPLIIGSNRKGRISGQGTLKSVKRFVEMPFLHQLFIPSSFNPLAKVFWELLCFNCSTCCRYSLASSVSPLA